MAQWGGMPCHSVGFQELHLYNTTPHSMAEEPTSATAAMAHSAMLSGVVLLQVQLLEWLLCMGSACSYRHRRTFMHLHTQAHIHASTHTVACRHTCRTHPQAHGASHSSSHSATTSLQPAPGIQMTRFTAVCRGTCRVPIWNELEQLWPDHGCSCHPDGTTMHTTSTPLQ